MFILGLILVIVAVLAALGVFVSGGAAAAPLSVFGLTVEGTTVAAVFLVGIVVTVVFFIGLALLSSGARRSRRRRKETREAKRQKTAQRRSVTELEEEKSRLEGEQAHKRDQGQRGTPTG